MIHSPESFGSGDERLPQRMLWREEVNVESEPLAELEMQSVQVPGAQHERPRLVPQSARTIGLLGRKPPDVLIRGKQLMQPRAQHTAHTVAGKRGEKNGRAGG